MSLGSVMETGLSGLYAATTQLSTAGQNISNASVDGYSRQSVVLAANQPQSQNRFFLGTGVSVQAVRRAYDAFTDQQLRDAKAESTYFETLKSLTGQVDAALSSDESSALSGIQSLFAKFSALATSPTSAAARQLVVSNASAMVDRFASLQGRLDSIRRGVEDGISTAVSEVNSLTSQLAKVNVLVRQSAAGASATPSGDLLDQRDGLVNKIASLINTTVSYASDGSARVTVANGITLVDGGTSLPISASPDPDDPARKVVTFTVGGTTISPPESDINGGRIGALLAVRSQTLDVVDGQLGRLAVAISSAVNIQNRRGSDLNGAGGVDFFVDQTQLGSPTASVRNNPNSTTAINGSIADTSKLTGLNYQLDFDGSSWRITDSEGRSVTPTITTPGGGDPATYFRFDGIQLSLTGTATAGDRFQLRPTAGKAGDLALNSVIQSDPKKIAASAAVTTTVTATAVGSPGSSISASSVSDLSKVKGSSYDFFFNGTNWYARRDGKVLVDVTGAGPTFSFEGLSVTVGGTPASGDRFTLSVAVAANNTNATGNGGNALAIANIQSDTSAIGGAATLSEGYSQLATAAGVQAAAANTGSTAQTALVQQLKSQQQAISGVNLDEEAANLLRFQQAYQASSKLIAVAGRLLDSILQIN